MKSCGNAESIVVVAVLCSSLLFMAVRKTVYGQSAPTAQSGSSQQIHKLEIEDEVAQRNYDTAVLDRHMAPEIALVLGSGKRWTKEEYLTEMKRWKVKRDMDRDAGKPEAPEMPAKLDDVTIHEFGDTVVFACLARFPFKDEQGKLRYRSYRDVDVWMKVNGEWKKIAASATTVVPPISHWGQE